MRKKHLFVLFVSVFIALVGILVLLKKPTGYKSKPDTSTTQLPEGKVAAEVIMKDDSYQPEKIQIKVGQAIRFVNASTGNHWPASNIHPTHDLYPEFDPKKELKPGETWTFTFHKKGLWRMHDHLLPYIKGVVTVE